MRLLVCVVILVSTCAAAGSALAAQPARPGQGDPAGLRAQREAARLMGAAASDQRRLRPSCTPRLPRTTSIPLTDAEPSATVRSVLGIFRRPATPEEVGLASKQRGFLIGAAERSRQGVRIAHSASGERVVVTYVPRTRRWGLSPARQRSCNATLAKLLDRRARRAAPAVKRELRRMTRSLRRQASAADPAPRSTEGLSVSWGNGAGGGAFDVQEFAVRGTYLSMGTRDGSRLIGLVPDGVASVELRYPRFAPRGQYRAPMDYGRRHERTVRVQENVFVVRVPRDARDAMAPKMVFRTPSGTVLRVVEPYPGAAR